MNKYKFNWTGQYLTIDDDNGKRVGFKCASRRKANFLEQLVIDANLGTSVQQEPQTDQSPDLDDAFNFTE